MSPSAKQLLRALESYSVPNEELSSERLLSWIQKNKETAYGKQYGFKAIKTINDYKSKVPICDYNEFEPWIKRIADGDANMLTSESILGFEKTSGTQGASKWIPITHSFKIELARGFKSWMETWKYRYPKALNGPAYWALSPAGFKNEISAAGLPIGMPTDGAYFPDNVAHALAGWLRVPENLRLESLFKQTAKNLLQCEDLAAISVWSPTFLLCLDEALSEIGESRSWDEIWPKLAVVSCWTDASSAQWIEYLTERMGTIPIESKGLLSTEGIVSLPHIDSKASRLATECHYHEFLDPHTSHSYDACEVKPGTIYEIALTTGSGFYRYKTGDLVQILDSEKHEAPRLKFIGRSNTVDFVGEKLSENFVAQAFCESKATGYLEADETTGAYSLKIEKGSADRVINFLCRNPYFNQALLSGQLPPVASSPLHSSWKEKWIEQQSGQTGCRMGDVKIPVLHRVKKR